MEKISILYINAMGPQKNTPQGGVFVTQRIRALKHFQGIETVPVYPFWRFSSLARMLLRIRGIADGGVALTRQNGVSYELFQRKYTLAELVLQRFFPQILYRKSRKTLRAVLKKHTKIQIIHMHWFYPYGFALPDVAKEYGIYYVVTCHGSDINIAMRNEGYRKYITDILEHAYCVEFVSHALLNSAVELGYSGRNAVVIHNGIDTECFCGKRTGHSVFTVGFVGNLIPIKGADRLPELFAKINQQTDGNVRFLVAGDGAIRATLEEEMRELPAVFYGMVSPERLAEIYAQMDVLVIPSRNEGYGCVINEAQACGVIPVGVDVGGIAEAVGEYGAIVPADGGENEIISVLSETVVSYYTGQRQVDIEAMMESAKNYSWRNRQKESVSIYFRALGTEK